MGSEETALAEAESQAIEALEPRLWPSSRWGDAGLNVAIYLALVIPATFVGLGAQLLVLAGAIAFAIHRRRAWYRSVALRRDIQLALASDDIGEATRLGRRLLEEMPGRSLAHTVAVAWWGGIELRRGRPEQAVEVMKRALGTGRFGGRTGRILEAWRLNASLSLAHAVLGDLDAAQSQLDAADAQVGDRARGGLFTVRAYLLARRGDAQEVVELFDAQWRSAEPQLSISGARAARMLEAFALEQTPGPEYRSGSGERLDKAIDRAREAPPGAYAYMAVHWPELRDFLERHGLK